MSHVFPRHTKKLPPKAVRGEGCYLYDESGKAYFDGSGGAAVSCLGHGDAAVTAAIRAQLDSVAQVYGFRNADACDLRCSGNSDNDARCAPCIVFIPAT